ncbi:hypothetical protein F4781DRAFT_406275 [Annulohypoxylon bovei var. microspora]|nr:hypothetical protein F4781DRAFT_406275 [Annulohypoxylon bovei var. microspora]
MARGYNERNSVYNARPYLAQAYCLSEDSLEDDLCVWDDGPTLSEINMSEEQLSFYDEPIYPILNRKNAQRNESVPTEQQDDSNPSEPGSDITERAEIPIEDQVNLTDERQTADALLATQRNLTRMLQFILKLERRAGKVTKEGIRQTLDATVASSTNAPEQDHNLTRRDEIENLKLLSENAWERLYLVDRHWRKQSRQDHDAGAQESPKIQIESEPTVKAWLKEEAKINNTVGEDPCYYTVADLAAGRSFEDWVTHLKHLCKFKDDPADETKLVELAWRFLDRDLRGSRPDATTRVSDFVLELEDRSRSGAFEEALENPRKQVEDDGQAWKTIRKCLGSRIQHY